MVARLLRLPLGILGALSALALCPQIIAQSALEASFPTEARRLLPTWFDDAKLGFFVHWGLYAVPGFAPRSGETAEVVAKGGWELWFSRHPGSEWYFNSLRIPGSPVEQFHRAKYGDAFRYEDFAPRLFEAMAPWKPDEWADLFKSAGARYVVFTAKHHDGFLMWPGTFHAATNRPALASTRDVTGELAAAVRKAGLRFGTYYSSGLDGSLTHGAISNVADMFVSTPIQTNYLAAVDRHWRDLIARYKPDILWNDLGTPLDLRVQALFAEYYEVVPDGVVNDRFTLGLLPNAIKPPADFRTPPLDSIDRQLGRPFEVARPLGASAGFNREERAEDLIPLAGLVRLLVDAVSHNGRLSIMIGPDATGHIPPPHRRRLEELGAWMNIHGESLHGTRPWFIPAMKSPEGLELRFTENGTNLFVHVLNPGRSQQLTLAPMRGMAGTAVALLGQTARPEFILDQERMVVTLPQAVSGWPVATLRISPQPIWLKPP